MRLGRAALATATALAVAGCGGGLGKEELAEKANAICARSAKELNRLGRPANIGDPRASAGFYAKVVPIVERQLAELRKLDPAKDVKAAWDRFLAKEAQAVALFKKLLRKAQANDRSVLEDLRGASQLSRELNTAATSVGATSCR